MGLTHLKLFPHAMPSAQLKLYNNSNVTVIDTVNVWENAQHLINDSDAQRFLTVDSDGDGIYIECPDLYGGLYW